MEALDHSTYEWSNGVYAERVDGAGSAVYASRSGSGDGNAMTAAFEGPGAGHAVDASRTGEGEGDTIIAQHSAAAHGSAVAGYKRGDATGWALFGWNEGTAEGDAVYGHRENGPGAGVHALGELALLVDGRSRFSTAGHGHIEAGASSASVDMGSANSHVTVSLVTDPGAPVAVSWIERADDSFTVHLTGNVAAETVFSWFVVDLP